MFARMRRGIGHMFGKKHQAALGGCGIQAAVEFDSQRVVKLERAELARRGGKVVESAA